MKNEDIQMTMKAREHDVSDASQEVVAEGCKAAGDGLTGIYKKIETGVVDGFNKVSNKCVEVLFAKEGESAEDAKKRLSGKE